MLRLLHNLLIINIIDKTRLPKKIKTGKSEITRKPFYDLSHYRGSKVAMQHISNFIVYMKIISPHYLLSTHHCFPPFFCKSGIIGHNKKPQTIENQIKREMHARSFFYNKPGIEHWRDFFMH